MHFCLFTPDLSWELSLRLTTTLLLDSVGGQYPMTQHLSGLHRNHPAHGLKGLVNTFRGRGICNSIWSGRDTFWIPIDGAKTQRHAVEQECGQVHIMAYHLAKNEESSSPFFRIVISAHQHHTNILHPSKASKLYNPLSLDCMILFTERNPWNDLIHNFLCLMVKKWLYISHSRPKEAQCTWKHSVV